MPKTQGTGAGPHFNHSSSICIFLCFLLVGLLWKITSVQRVVFLFFQRKSLKRIDLVQSSYFINRETKAQTAEMAPRQPGRTAQGGAMCLEPEG